MPGPGVGAAEGGDLTGAGGPAGLAATWAEKSEPAEQL